MRLETTLTHLLEEYTHTGLLQESLKAPPVVTTLVERLLCNDNIPIGEAKYWLQGVEGFPSERDGFMALNLMEWFEDSYGESFEWNPLGVLLESGHYTRDYLDIMSDSEFHNLVELMYKMPQEAVDAIFDYNTYQRQKQTSSLYDNIVPFVDEQYRISDHWNIWRKIRGTNGNLHNHCYGQTTDKRYRVNSFCLGKKIGNKWEIITEFGAPVKRTQQENLDILKRLKQSGLFDGNIEILEYINTFLGENNDNN